MAENEYAAGYESGECFKEAVCIDAMRIYDSCSDKDCLEDMRVMFPASRQSLVDGATNVRVKEVSVITVYVDMQPILFNKGFYSIDMTFFFDVAVELYSGAASCPVTVNGVSVFNKKVILYGSEGNVKVFSSGGCDEFNEDESRTMPKATVQVAPPVALSAKLCDRPSGGCEPYCRIPDCIAQRYGEGFDCYQTGNTVYVTVGLFIIVQIVRNVQMLVPSYDYCIPEKECVSSGDNPCELFRRLEFPTEEFFPPRASESSDGCGKCR